MALKGQIERIEQTVKEMKMKQNRSVRDLSDEELRNAIISKFELSEDTRQSELDAVIQARQMNPEDVTDDWIVNHVRASARQLNDLPDDFTDEELLTRFHRHFDKVRGHCASVGRNT